MCVCVSECVCCVCVSVCVCVCLYARSWYCMVSGTSTLHYHLNNLGGVGWGGVGWERRIE